MTINGINSKGFFRSSAPMPIPTPTLDDSSSEKRNLLPLVAAITVGTLGGLVLLGVVNDNESEPTDTPPVTTVLSAETPAPNQNQETSITLPATATEDIVGLLDS